MSLENKILDKVNNFRDFLGLKSDYVNLFDYIVNQENYIEKYKMILFKKNLGETSGFIGYVDDYALICINTDRTVGHQNFTLAHEFGHLVLHNGKDFNDKKIMQSTGDTYENEANEFARELLYPKLEACKNYNKLIDKNLLDDLLKLSDFINDLAIKYFISHKFAFHRTLIVGEFEGNRNALYNRMIKEVGTLSNRYNNIFYNKNIDHHYYRSFNGGIKDLEDLVDKLIRNSYISRDRGNVILNRNKEI